MPSGKLQSPKGREDTLSPTGKQRADSEMGRRHMNTVVVREQEETRSKG